VELLGAGLNCLHNLTLLKLGILVCQAFAYWVCGGIQNPVNYSTDWQSHYFLLSKDYMSDFASAASRHLRAAKAYLPTCPDTAGYLLGYAAECSVKAIIDIAGIKVQRHIDQITPEHLILAADLSLAVRRYPVDLNADLQKLRTEWSTSLRYSRTGTLTHQQVTEFHRLVSSVYMKTVLAMVLDGLIDVVPQ